MVAMLLIFSSMILFFKYYNGKSNNFDRNIIRKQVKLKDVHEFTSEKFGFVNVDYKYIYIYFYTDLSKIYNLNYELTVIDTLNLKFPTKFDINVRRVRKNIFKNDIYTINILGDIAIFKKNNISYKKIKNIYTDRIEVISENSIVVRSNPFKKEGRIRQLLKLDLSGHPVIAKVYTFPMHVNNIFFNDGKLYYDNVSKRIFYLYYYRGEIVSLDSNLNILKYNKTIDTIKQGNISTKPTITKLKNGLNDTRITLSIPPTVVNSSISVNDDYIYVQSNLKADNEIQSELNKSQVIDVYQILTGKYKYSFYIPKYRGIKMRDFQIKDDLIIAIFGKYLVTYSLSKYTDKT